MVLNSGKALIFMVLLALTVSGLYQGLALAHVPVSVDSPMFMPTLAGIINGFALAILGLIAMMKVF